MAPTTQYNDSPRQPGRLQPKRQGRIGVIVTVSLASGLVAGLILLAAPFIKAQENVLTGVVLLGFAFGWALLAVLSIRFSDQPQRWAAAPALFFALAGVISLIGSEAVSSVWGWIWPPVLLALVVWIVIRARRHLHSRTRQWLLYPLLAVLALAAMGGGYQTVRESIDAAAYPMPGQLIDVGGHRLHLSCMGSGSPTVVLEPGLGEASSAMAWITPAVARDSRVCVYDRAGRGWSDAADGPQDAAQTATDLHTLLERAHIPGPYVLAGHSFGGLYILTFAAKLPRPGCRHGVAGLHRTCSGSDPCPADQDRVLRLPRSHRSVTSSRGSLRCGPDVRSVLLRQSAATLPRRGARQERHRQRCRKLP